MNQMTAVEYDAYGSPDVLELKQVEKPTPNENEILVKIYATTVTATECTFRKGRPFISRLFTGLLKPKLTRLGEELAGEVTAVGAKVTQFKPGDDVFGTAGPKFGANAEYLCVAADGVLARLPQNLSYEQSAASVDGFLTALPFLRDTGKLQAGQSILIYGASGSVGSAAVQVAKYLGAQVTAVCSGSNIQLVKSLGADHAIDYTQEDFTTLDHTYDIIFDAVGKTTFNKCKPALTPTGLFLEAGIGLGVIRHVLWTAVFGGKKAKFAATGLRPPAERKKDLLLLKTLLEDGVIKPVIDRSYALEQLSSAHTYVDKGHKKGNVVITVRQS